MEEKEQHLGREHLGIAVSVIVEIVAIQYGVGWLTWIAALFLSLAVFGYTKKWAREKPRIGWGARVVAVVIILVAAVLLTWPKKHETVTATRGPDRVPESTQHPVPLAPPADKAPPRSEKRRPKASPVAPPTVTQNCPNGICNGGDNNGNQQVNNYGPPKLTLPPDKVQLLIAALEPLSGKNLTIVVVNGNTDLNSLRDQFVRACHEDNIRCRGLIISDLDPMPPDGVSLLIGSDRKFDSDEVTALANALVTVGLATAPVTVARTMLFLGGGPGIAIAPTH